MTIPSDPFTPPAGSHEPLHTPSLFHPLDDALDARMRRLTHNYYSGRSKYQILEDLVRQKQSLGEDLTDHEQHILHTPYPSLAQYLAYLSRLDAAARDEAQTDTEPDH